MIEGEKAANWSARGGSRGPVGDRIRRSRRFPTQVFLGCGHATTRGSALIRFKGSVLSPPLPGTPSDHVFLPSYVPVVNQGLIRAQQRAYPEQSVRPGMVVPRYDERCPNTT